MLRFFRWWKDEGNRSDDTDGFPESSLLDDGTEVKRVFSSEELESKRLLALNKLGGKWLLHPANNVKKQE